MRGDRIGLIGPNGAGKTTLLQADPRRAGARQRAPCGSARTSQVAYFDQMREQLDPERTLAETISPGSDWVEIGGRAQARAELPRRLPVPAAARERAGQDALGRRAQPPAAGAAVRAAGQPAGARRADQRSRHRDARAARGDAAGLRRHAAPGEPRPRVPRQRRHADAGRRGRRALARVRRRLQRLAAHSGRRPTPAPTRAHRAPPSEPARARPAPSSSFKEQRELEALPGRSRRSSASSTSSPSA